MSKQTLSDILAGFQNGDQRYEKDAYFKEAITAIHVGVGPTAVLDRVLKEHTILMNLHNEALNKNRVAVAEVARLTDELIDSEANLNVEVMHNNNLRTENKRLIEEAARLTENLQHYQK